MSNVLQRPWHVSNQRWHVVAVTFYTAFMVNRIERSAATAWCDCAVE